MPLIRVHISEDIDKSKYKELLPLFSALTAEYTGKPEQYVMVTCEKTSMMMSGVQGNSAFIEIKSLGGLNQEINRKLSSKLCSLLEKKLLIPKNRVYINYTDMERQNWGFNGTTF
ncbi:MAG TPA: phenylpyruvate tautomerase MIF-related protein [Victivallales bacterium]|nr:phenylpyruvate tautomerase MIF-related protein [Victivallales bacterium]